MAFGPGTYDDLCTHVRTQAQARGALVIVLAGTAGDGFSAQLPAADLARVPDLLEHVAAAIRADLRRPPSV